VQDVKLSLKSTAFAAAVLWGGAVLMVTSINMFRPGYGAEFLRMISSVYPGYQPIASVREVLIGTSYALLDGAVAGLVFAWLYNLCACKKK